jgi:hypothetical protein
MFQGIVGNSNRDEWEFEYTASSIALAAAAQMEFRLQRAKVWDEKKAQVMTKVRESGLTVHEGVAAEMSGYSSHGHRGATVRLDATLQSDLDECVAKISTHREAAKSYEGWIQVLNANPEARLKLKYNDWMFFFGK